MVLRGGARSTGLACRPPHPSQRTTAVPGVGVDRGGHHSFTPRDVQGSTGDEAVCRWTRQVRMWTWRPPSAGLWVLNGHERQKFCVCLPRSGCVVPGAFWFFRSFSMSQGFSSLTRPTLNRSSSNPQFKPGSRAPWRSFLRHRKCTGGMSVPPATQSDQVSKASPDGV